MGKGDRKTKKGKIRIGSYGKLRPRKKATNTFVPKKVEKAKEQEGNKKESSCEKNYKKESSCQKNHKEESSCQKNHKEESSCQKNHKKES